MSLALQFSTAANQDLQEIFEIIIGTTVSIGAIRHQHKDDDH